MTVRRDPRVVTRLSRLAVVFALTLILGTAPCAGHPSANANAADLPGAKDHPLIKRSAGSEIVGYDVKRFDEYDLQTSTFQRYNLETKRREFTEAPLKLEGGRTQIWYESAGDTSATEIVRNYAANRIMCSGL